MTSQSPRIYLYKITFEEVPYYYYGVHREKVFDEEYWGSPVTNKWCWELYTPKKQILELFEFSDSGWLEANLVEDRLIKPFYNTDKWCLNEGYGGRVSYECSVKGGITCKENKVGIFALTKEQRSEIGKMSGNKAKKLGIGVHSLTKEELSAAGKKGGSISGKIVGNMCKEKKLGICGRSKEKMSEDGRKGGKIGGTKTYKEGKGCFSLTPEERKEINKKTNKKLLEEEKGIFALTNEERSKLGKKTTSQIWKCMITGHISNPGGLSNFQKKRGIDTSKRVRVS
jgi:general stress protein YciG